jgi:hypothetical protein
MFLRFLTSSVFALALCAALPALAGTQTVSGLPAGYTSYSQPAVYGTPSTTPQAAAPQTPDFFYVGLGAFDFDQDHPHDHAPDFRAEYRWGVSLLPLLSDSFLGVDRYVQIHPMAGVEFTAFGAVYGHGGFAVDIPFLRHGLFTWSEAAGLFARGAQNPVGSVLEFRSQAELGWRFNNEMRLMGYFSHISNGGLTLLNPGTEVVGAYLAFPLRWR